MQAEWGSGAQGHRPIGNHNPFIDFGNMAGLALNVLLGIGTILPLQIGRLFGNFTHHVAVFVHGRGKKSMAGGTEFRGFNMHTMHRSIINRVLHGARHRIGIGAINQTVIFDNVMPGKAFRSAQIHILNLVTHRTAHPVQRQGALLHFGNGVVIRPICNSLGAAHGSMARGTFIFNKRFKGRR